MQPCYVSSGASALATRWRGDTRDCTKEELCGEIVGIMENAGITHRRNADVRSKIGEIVEDYRKARDWLDHTGSGITGDEAGETIRGRFALRSR